MQTIAQSEIVIQSLLKIETVLK